MDKYALIDPYLLELRNTFQCLVLYVFCVSLHPFEKGFLYGSA